jgi:hypothetical protein
MNNQPWVVTTLIGGEERLRAAGWQGESKDAAPGQTLPSRTARDFPRKGKAPAP